MTRHNNNNKQHKSSWTDWPLVAWRRWRAARAKKSWPLALSNRWRERERERASERANSLEGGQLFGSGRARLGASALGALCGHSKQIGNWTKLQANAFEATRTTSRETERRSKVCKRKWVWASSFCCKNQATHWRNAHLVCRRPECPKLVENISLLFFE